MWAHDLPDSVGVCQSEVSDERTTQKAATQKGSLMSDDKKADVFGGAYYFRPYPGARLERIGPELGDAAPQAWICRRVADFPNGILPAGAATTTCRRCGVAIAYNPGRVLSVPIDTPQICMQCAHVEPLPIEP